MSARVTESGKRKKIATIITADKKGRSLNLNITLIVSIISYFKIVALLYHGHLG